MLEPDYTVDVSRTAGAELFYRCGHLRLYEAMLCPMRQSPGDSFDAIPVRDRPTGKNKTAYPDETRCLLRLFETSSSVAQDLLLTGDVAMRISLLELACLALAKGLLDPNSLMTDARVPVLLLSHLNRAPPA